MFGLSTKPQVLTVRDWYVESFEDIREMKEINSMEREEKFTELLSSVMKRHNDVVPMIASGVLELKNELAGKSKKGGSNNNSNGSSIGRYSALAGNSPVSRWILHVQNWHADVDWTTRGVTRTAKERLRRSHLYRKIKPVEVCKDASDPRESCQR